MPQIVTATNTAEMCAAVRPKDAFKHVTRYPHGRPGYVIDQVVPLACGGAEPSNMQWQTVAPAKAKDKNQACWLRSMNCAAPTPVRRIARGRSMLPAGCWRSDGYSRDVTILGLLERSTIRPQLGSVLPLEQVRLAHEMLGRGAA
jgi:hypothetical protein